MNAIKYIMFGKFANCESEKAKHIVVVAVGICSEESYQNGEIVKYATITLEHELLSMEEIVAKPAEPTEMDDYQNIAFYIVNTNDYRAPIRRITSIISIDKETKEIKIVDVSRHLYFNVGNDRYNKFASARKIEQNIEALNANLDMDIADFIAVDFQGLSDIVDAMGGVWIDVQGINEDDAVTSNQIMEQATGIKDLPILENGNQLLNGKQLATYFYYMSQKNQSESVCQTLMAVHEQMQIADSTTLERISDICYTHGFTSLKIEEFEDIKYIADYNYAGSGVFPQENMREVLLMGSKGRCFVPTDLESNVIWLHKFLFNQDNYEVSDTVKEYSEQIEENAAEYRTE